MAVQTKLLALLIVAFLVVSCGGSPVPTVESTQPPATSTTPGPRPTLARPTVSPHMPPTPTDLPPTRLLVESTPAGASIRLDGNELDAVTPWEGEISPGTHQIELTLPEYEPWQEEVGIGPGITLRVEAQLAESCHFTVLENEEWYGPEGIWATVQSVQWEPDGQALRYAVGHNRDEPKDWLWFRYDVSTDAAKVVPAPARQVSDEVRAELGLCPLAQEKTITCTVATLLSESPSGRYMVYAPPDELLYGPDGKTLWGGCFKLWHADTEGRGQVLLGPQLGCLSTAGEGGRPRVVWSPREDWILIDDSYEIANAYLAKTDGSVFTRVPRTEDLYVYLNGALPVFSPDGARIAFIGTSGDPGKRAGYATWVIDVEGDHLERVSDQLGLLQWSSDSRYLYVFEFAWKRALHRIDLTQTPPQETVLAIELPIGPYSSSRLPDYATVWESMWALSPDETRVACYGVDEKGRFGFLRFVPGE